MKSTHKHTVLRVVREELLRPLEALLCTWMSGHVRDNDRRSLVHEPDLGNDPLENERRHRSGGRRTW